MCVLVEGSKWVRLPSVCGSKCVLVPSQSGFQVSVRHLIGVTPYMTVMTDISAFDTWQCHWNSTGNGVTE